MIHIDKVQINGWSLEGVSIQHASVETVGNISRISIGNVAPINISNNIVNRDDGEKTKATGMDNAYGENQ